MSSALRTPPELMIALDYPSAEAAEKTIRLISSQAFSQGVIFKVGLELFISAGPAWVRKLTSEGHRVFLDLKLHDIPNTVGKATEQAAELGVEFLTIHLAGGSEMIQAAQKSKQKSSKNLKILGVSVLTSFSSEQWAGVTQCVGGARSVAESVDALVKMGVNAGLGGIVCSAEEVASLRKQYPSLYTVVPGIRPQGADQQDQSRVVTPDEAARRGASAIVVGRPITQASDPLLAIDQILQEMRNA